MDNFYINGRFLTQRLSGVQRYAREVVLAIDTMLSSAENRNGANWHLLAPRGSVCDLDLKRINFVSCGNLKGHAWEQVDLLKASKNGRLLSLGNSGPILHSRQLVIIHDATVFRHPRNFTRPYSIFHQTLSRILGRTSTIGTVSHFSKSELSKVISVREDKIVVAPNGSDHFGHVSGEGSVAAQNYAEGRKFFIFVGSPTPNKNLATAVSAFKIVQKYYPNTRFIVVGNLNNDVFETPKGLNEDSVIFTGFLPDADITCLLSKAEALVFPSIYEGFGIPPLEAMVHSCPVIASDIPSVREVCGDAAIFSSPHDIDGFASAMTNLLSQPSLREQLVEAGRNRSKTYNWASTASVIVQTLNKIQTRAA